MFTPAESRQIRLGGHKQARAAREGFVRFGKGRHAAGLNFGDCFS